MNPSARLRILLLIIACTVSLDRATKRLARSTLMDESRISLAADTVRLEYVENEGAFLGLGGRLHRSLRFWLFTIVNGAVLLWIALWTWRNRRRRLRETLGLCLVWSGGISNLADRILNEGRVVDFLNLGIGPVRTGIFNLADLAIMAGLALLIGSWLKKASPKGSRSPS